MLYYLQVNNSAIMNRDCLSMLGWWSISITFPKVMKGKYEIYIFQPGWYDVTNCVASIDGFIHPTFTGATMAEQVAMAVCRK
jgi:hypothetical protein